MRFRIKLAVYALSIFLLCAESFGQSYDPAYSAPPQSHSERTPLFSPDPFYEKRRLIIYRDCESGQFVINLAIGNSSVPIKLEMRDPDTVIVSVASATKLTPTGAKNLASKIRFPNTFNLLVLFYSDTAVYRVNFDLDRDSTIVTTLKEGWFVGLESILPPPEGLAAIYAASASMEPAIVRDLKTRLAAMGLKYIVLEESYYKCWGMIGNHRGKNYIPGLGRVLFFEMTTESRTNLDSLRAIVAACDGDLRITFSPYRKDDD
jgi:hypothetical protein